MAIAELGHSHKVQQAERSKVERSQVSDEAKPLSSGYFRKIVNTATTLPLNFAVSLITRTGFVQNQIIDHELFDVIAHETEEEARAKTKGLDFTPREPFGKADIPLIYPNKN